MHAKPTYGKLDNLPFRLTCDQWLYAVFNCGGQPEVHSIQNPARWSWKPVMAVEQYRIGVAELMEAVQ